MKILSRDTWHKLVSKLLETQQGSVTPFRRYILFLCILEYFYCVMCLCIHYNTGHGYSCTMHTMLVSATNLASVLYSIYQVITLYYLLAGSQHQVQHCCITYSKGFNPFLEKNHATSNSLTLAQILKLFSLPW